MEIGYHVGNPMEKLADRIRWEPTAHGIQLLIPARLDWKTPFFAIWLAGWTIGGKLAFNQVVREHAAGRSVSFLALWLVAWVAAECLVVGTILWSVAGSTLLRLDPATMSIEHRLFGAGLISRSFATSEIRNLRFTPVVARGRSYVASRISFEVGDKTRSFGSGISDAEAFAIIDKMLDVYPFPKERALEYLDLAR